MLCCICNTRLEADVLADTFRCPSCAFRTSNFPVQINELRTVNEGIRIAGLKQLREANFKQILDQCSDFLPPDAKLLDVGCGHGWFIEAAHHRGYTCDGVEPDAGMASIARRSGATIHQGYFPDIIPAGTKYDAILFNDVFEHIPDIGHLPRRIRDHLTPRGVLIINLPMSDGLIYRCSALAAALGVEGPLARLWQRGLPSPHVSYFSHHNLAPLICKEGFDLVARADLQSLLLNGLWGRIRADANLGFVGASATYAAALALRSLTALFPSDVAYFVFRLGEHEQK